MKKMCLVCVLHPRIGLAFCGICQRSYDHAMARTPGGLFDVVEWTAKSVRKYERKEADARVRAVTDRMARILSMRARDNERRRR